MCRRLPRSSFIVVISDWFESAAVQALAFAQHRRHQLAALQLVDEIDLNPPWVGSLQLEDVETGEQRRLTLDGPALSGYRERFENHCQELQQRCRGCNFPYYRARTEDGVEAIVLRQLVAQGWLR